MCLIGWLFGSNNNESQSPVEIAAPDPIELETKKLKQWEFNLKNQQQKNNQRVINLDQKVGRIKENWRQLKQAQNKLIEDKKQLVAQKEHLRLGREALQEKEIVLSDRDKLQNSREEKLIKSEAELDKRQEESIKLDGELAERLRHVEQRESEAEAGFAERNRESLKTLEENRAKRRGEVDEEIERHRQDRLQSLEKEIKRRTVEMEKKESRLDEMNRDLQAEKDNLNKRQGQVETAERNLELDRQLCREERESIEEKAKALSSEQVISIQQELDNCLQEIERQRSEREVLHNRIFEFEEIKLRFENKSPHEVLKHQDFLEKKIERYKKKTDNMLGIEEKHRLDALVKEKDTWEEDQNRLTQRIAELEAEQTNWVVTESSLENMRNQKEAAMRQRDAIVAQMEKLSAEVERLRKLYKTAEKREERIKEVLIPVKKNLPPGNEKKTEEDQWLNDIHQKCLDSGIVFKRRILNAFHTALKTAEWSPLTVLAGVSGTGKSELPRLYSRFGGMVFLPLSVQPNWDSPQSLFGFFNSVDNRFNATELLRMMVQSQEPPESTEYKHGFNNRMLLVLLDEMNLAHVELYFSELLSKLEMRRGVEDVPEIEIDLGAGIEPYGLPLGRNVLWAGTINQDETTKSLSDKVLDRGNIISFPRPRDFERREKLELADESNLISVEQWKSWCQVESAIPDKYIEDYKSKLEKINEYIEKAGRALGHRVWQSIENYMKNHPQVLSAQNCSDDSTDKLEDALKLAFEDQLVQKVMPKLRGIDTTGKTNSVCLQPILKLLEDYDLNLTKDFLMACKNGYGLFLWNSAKYLEESE